MKIFILTVIGVIVATLIIVSLRNNQTSNPVNLITDTKSKVSVKKAFFPEPTNYAVDTVGKLNQNTVDTLNSLLKSFDPKAQVAVVVVDTTSPESLEEYSIHLADKWKVGYKGIDNGVILLVAVKDRKIRIEVGRGIEDKITDAEAGRIINEIISPKLRNGDWDGGITAGVNAIMDQLK